MESVTPSRFRVPAGSLLVDGALVIALIWSQATTVATQQGFDTRLHNAEATLEHRNSLEPRISVLEAIERSQDKNYEELKADIVKRLDRIESKLDKIK